ncbi:MAG: 50S ribosomal protein P1 [Candidatus Altiarchaeales archaeon HGW-Altiarchaeales-1]|nr:MAG: 50S ribosomal protein P1 [Candidatus Altiarchaeales archaeon HGW-Altiarchaeales-1]
MEYMYGALLLHSAGQAINEENLTKVLTGANVKVNDAMVKAVVTSLEGVNIEDVLKNASAQAVAQPAQAQHAGKKEEKKEEEKEENAAEEDAAAGLSSLFG